MDEKTDYKAGRVFLRIIAYITISFYTLYGGYKKWTTDTTNLDTLDISLICAAIAILIAVESVRVYVKRKLENKN